MPNGQVVVTRFSDGSMAVFCAGQGMHLRPEQAEQLIRLVQLQAATAHAPVVEHIDYGALVPGGATPNAIQVYFPTETP